MERKLPREEAWELLTKYTKTSALQNHALAVEAVMRHFARLNGEDEEVWGVAGLLHDLDYEMYRSASDCGGAGTGVGKRKPVRSV